MPTPSERLSSAAPRGPPDRLLGGEDYDPDNSLAVAVFCGCQDCIVPEVLHAAWPFLRQAALDGAE